MGKKVLIPPRLGGGDFVMREMLAGEFEDSVKRTSEVPKGREIAAVVDGQAKQVLDCILLFNGKPLPDDDLLRYEWWRSQTAAMRGYLIAVHEKMNNVPAEEIDDFFGKAEVVATPR